MGQMDVWNLYVSNKRVHTNKLPVVHYYDILCLILSLIDGQGSLHNTED